MATVSKTTCTNTCDLCGTERPSEELRRFGLFPVVEGAPTPGVTGAGANRCDVCVDCRGRPIRDMLERLKTTDEQRLARARRLSDGRAGAEAAEGGGKPSSCPSCGADASLIDMGLAPGIGSSLPDPWRCMSCGHQWETPNPRLPSRQGTLSIGEDDRNRS